MSYTAFSVSFGEVPSESKWNTLGANDASFNDGSGILDDAIIQRHFADESVGVPQLTAALQDYKELGRDTAAAAVTELEVVFTAKKHLLILFSAKNADASNINTVFNLNGDTGNNYAQRYNSNHGSDVDDGSIGGWAGEVGSIVTGGNIFGSIHVFNPSGADKIGQLYAVHQTGTSAATPPSWSDNQVLWNSSAQVNTVKYASGTASSLAAGSELIILGHD